MKKIALPAALPGDTIEYGLALLKKKKRSALVIRQSGKVWLIEAAALVRAAIAGRMKLRDIEVRSRVYPAGHRDAAAADLVEAEKPAPGAVAQGSPAGLRTHGGTIRAARGTSGRRINRALRPPPGRGGKTDPFAGRRGSAVSARVVIRNQALALAVMQAPQIWYCTDPHNQHFVDPPPTGPNPICKTHGCAIVCA